MKTRIEVTRLAVALLFVLVLALIGCSSGSSPSSPSRTPTPSINVLPAVFNFGLITEGNSALPLQVEIQNNGTANLDISNMALAGNGLANFKLELGGESPCNSFSPTIGPGDSCHVVVSFDPINFGQFNADLLIPSNDPNSPERRLGLEGSYAELIGLNVIINQVDACPRDIATAYLSVLDNAGFPLSGLSLQNFTLKENGITPIIGEVDFVDSVTANQPLSVSLLMDYSNSILKTEGAVNNMERAAKLFVEDMNLGDEAEIIKYARSVEVITEEFTGDKDLLIEAIEYDPKFSGGTAIYDAIDIAVGNLKLRSNERKAIIIITDGRENSSLASLQEIIGQAQTNGIPVFTIGLGNVDTLELQNIADETGGAYYESPSSDNLLGIYKQLSELLFKNQYILTYTSVVAPTSSGSLEVTVNYNGITATSNPYTVTDCNP